MKIGIIGAMDEEVALVKDDVQNCSVRTIAGREYHSGNLHGIDTTVVFSRWGKVASASTATTLINTFEVDLIIFTGIAGAISSELNIGDIVVANRLYQHDMDARPIFDKHIIPLLGIAHFKISDDLSVLAHSAAENFLAKDLCEDLTHDVLTRFSITKAKTTLGTIASGDQFISDPKKAEELLKHVPDTKAVEMEGAAVAQVCYEHNTPCIVFRTISDKADHSAAIDFQKFVAEVSNHYSRGFIRNLYRMLSTQQKEG